MSNLLSTLVSSSTALRVYERGLNVAQNNVGNANTPGYVKQTVQPLAMAFDPARGLSGGVLAGEVRSSRNGYAEQYVRRHAELAGFAEQNVASLTAIENVLALSAENGIPVALSSLFQAFSAWGQDPNSQTARRQVLEQADSVGHAFRRTISELTAVRQETDLNLRSTADQINTLAGRLQEFNRLRQQGERTDAGLDARIHATLEELSGLVNFTALHQDDGTVTVLLGRQSLLVEGERAYQVSLDFRIPSEPPAIYPEGGNSARISNADGVDVTDILTGGKLGALLHIRNRALPSLLGDGQNIGELNRLAGTLADQVNSIMADGWVRNGESGATALFVVDPSNPAAAAKSLAVDPAATAESLPAIAQGDPPVSNGTALRLASLGQAASPALENLTLVEFYGAAAASIGREVQRGRDVRDQQLGFLANARSIRDEISGVSLDEEAIVMLQYQRAYQATARMIATLSALTEETINMMR
jgi:flagellar hook-associated protein 1 FlgK